MNYTGKKVKVVDSVYPEINGKTTKVLGQVTNKMNDTVLCLDIPHPEDSSVKLWVNASEVE